MQNLESAKSKYKSPKLESHDDAKDAQPPSPPRPQMGRGHSPPPQQFNPMPPSSSLYQQPMMPPAPYFHIPSYLNLPHYGYPMIFGSAPNGNICVDKRPWSTGLFECFSDPKNCFITTFCPCLTFGQVTEILNEGYTPWWEGAAAYFLVEIVTLSLGTFSCAWTYRSKMRRKHSIHGNPWNDFIISFCFTRFTLCQLYRQLDQLGYNVPLGWIANKDKFGQESVGNKLQVVPPSVESGMVR